MEVIIKRKERKTNIESSNEEKIRVVAYARVSTEEERQKGSFESQKNYYYEKIISNPEWVFKGIYGDEGISGTSSERRTGFAKMIRDAKNKKFDRILTKSISRFARNTVDTLKFLRFLKERKISVYFEEENIDTSAIQGELLITILSSLAQQESENTASHAVAGLEMALRNGTKTDSHKCYGYDYIKEEKKFVVNKYAENVKLIFDLYLKTGNIHSVKKELFKRGIKSPGGNDFWETVVIKSIIRNEKYIGNSIFGGHYVYDSLNHKIKKNNGERNMYRFVNHHEPIISKKVFEKANNLLTKNSEGKFKPDLKNREYTLLAWKGICGFCGSTLGVKAEAQHSMPSHQCRNSLVKISRYLCPNSTQIKDRELEDSFLKGIRKLRNKINLNTLDDNIESKLSYARSLILNNKLEKFDYELYDKIVNLVIVGGYNEDGTPNPFILRYILKEDTLFDNKRTNRKKFNGKTLEILSFDNRVNTYYGRYTENRDYYKMQIESIKVIIEIQDDEDLIWKL